jgi:hypothetical protein
MNVVSENVQRKYHIANNRNELRQLRPEHRKDPKEGSGGWGDERQFCGGTGISIF